MAGNRFAEFAPPADTAVNRFAKFIEQRPERAPLSAGETAADVAKSLGIGVVQGGIGLATLPGNIEALGRAGINYASRMAGIEEPVSPETKLWNYNDGKQLVEGVTGEFYEPKSTLGEYARTAGEFAPLAVGGVGAVSKATRVLAPAVASETAGQLTEGTSYEPWARFAGAVAGGRIPTPRSAPRVPRDPQHAQAVQRLEAEGVDAMTAAQRTGSAPTRWLEDATATVPGGGGRAVALQDQASEQFTRAALRRAGVNADRAEPAVMDSAFANIGREFDTFAQNQTATIDPFVARRLTRTVDAYERITPEAQRVPLVRAVQQELSRGGTMSGAQYQGYRSSLRRAQRGLKNNPQASRAVGEIVDSLDVAMMRSLPVAQRPAMRAQIRDMNARYRNLLAIEDAVAGAGESAVRGLISPAALRSAIKKQGKRAYVRGQSDLGELARAGERVLKPLKSSGTAERKMAQDTISTPGAVIGGLGSGSIEGAALGTILPWAAKAGTARTIMSRPGQFMIGHQGPVPFSIGMADTDSRTLAAILAAQGLPGRRNTENK